MKKKRGIQTGGNIKTTGDIRSGSNTKIKLKHISLLILSVFFLVFITLTVASSEDSVEYQLKGGWNMITFPFATVTSLGDNPHINNVLFHYNAETGGYDFAFATNPASINPAFGYWVNSDADTTLTVTGNLVSDPTCEFAVKDGWNQFGPPYNADCNWGEVGVRYNGSDYNVNYAIQQGWLINPVFSYNSTGGGYDFVFPQNDLESKTGYWSKATVDCSLVFDASAFHTPSPVPSPSPVAFLSSGERELLKEMLQTHLNYFLSSKVITVSGLPLGAYKESNRPRYNYSNPTEWGYTMLAWIIASEEGIITENEANTKLEKALDTLNTLQNNPAQNYQKLFYPYYYVTNSSGIDYDPPIHDSNHNIPSIDNGFLYTSLCIVQNWADSRGFSSTGNKAGSIKDNMNFRIFLWQDKSYISHLINADTGELSPSKWDVCSDEGGMMAWIAYQSGSVSFDEYKVLINNMMRPARSWNGISVAEAAWFNAMFTWGVRSWSGFPVATRETGVLNLYSSDSFANTSKAHLVYGEQLGVYYPAFSDAMTQVNMVGRYTPPNISNTVPGDIPQHIVPHAFFVPFCVGPELEPSTLATLMSKITDLKNDSAGYYHYGQDGHEPFGFEVTASSSQNNTTYSGVESRYIFETLSESYTVMSLYHGLNINDGKPTFVHYNMQSSNYVVKMNNAVNFLYPP